MIVKLLAKYFKDTNYHTISNCPLAQAIKHEFNTEKVHVGVYRSYIDMDAYFHQGYEPATFRSDYKLALRANFDDTVIREIELGKY